MSKEMKSAGETASAASNAPAKVAPGKPYGPRSVPEQQLDYVFGSIAELADMLGLLGAKMVDEIVPGAGADEALIVRHLADKVGWLADFGSSLVGGIQLRGGAAQWMLPPACHDAAGTSKRKSAEEASKAVTNHQPVGDEGDMELRQALDSALRRVVHVAESSAALLERDRGVQIDREEMLAVFSLIEDLGREAISLECEGRR